MEELSPAAEEALRPGDPQAINPFDAREFPTLALPYGTVPQIHASSGAQRVLSLAYLLVWVWHEHKRASALRQEEPAERIVLLVDELEAHLHPRRQRVILPALLKVVASLHPAASVQLIAVTHAPLMLASVETSFDPEQDALFVFDLVGEGAKRSVQVERAHWRKRGDANMWLVSDVLDPKEPRSLEAEQALEEARRVMNDFSASVAEVEAIHHDLLLALRDTDPFGPRWEPRARAAGIEM